MRLSLCLSWANCILMAIRWEEYEVNKDKLERRTSMRAAHIVGENDRVQKVCAADLSPLCLSCERGLVNCTTALL
jgi:hypothetical protein